MCLNENSAKINQNNFIIVIENKNFNIFFRAFVLLFMILCIINLLTFTASFVETSQWTYGDGKGLFQIKISFL